jgi:hypothetical protein
VTNLEAGSFQLSVHDGERGYSEPAEVTLREDATTDVSIRFGGTVVLAGRVNRPDGSPIANARLDVYASTGGSQEKSVLPGRAADNGTGNQASTDSEGRFRVGGLAKGRFTVRITSNDAAPLVEHLELSRENVERSFVLESGTEAAIALVGPGGGQGGADTVVRVRSLDDQALVFSKVSDAQGLVRFEHLPASVYEVTAVKGAMVPVRFDTRQAPHQDVRVIVD